MSNKKGLIYVLLNPCLPKMLKIGKTQRTAEERAKELSHTGLPVEFVVAYEHKVSNCDLVEQLVHKKLKRKRVNKDREFFQMPLKEAIKTIREVIKDLEKQHQLDFILQKPKVLTIEQWWNNLSFVWQQVFRSHLNITYQPNEIDLLRAVHNIINHCPDNKLIRKEVIKLITKSRFPQKIKAWYDTLRIEKNVFNSYLPYELSTEEIEQVFLLEKINCSNNLAIIDVKPLERLKQLKSLNCINTYVSDLSPLKGLLALEEIELNYTKIESLQPLETLPNLRKISCFSTDLSTQKIDSFQEKKKDCVIDAGSFLTAIPTTKAKRKRK